MIHYDNQKYMIDIKNNKSANYIKSLTTSLNATNNKNYNQLIKVPAKYSYEKLFRSENTYDLIIVLNYNMNPVIKNKGSAIFIHVAKKN